METQVTEKNTKAEILKAYDALLNEVQNAKADIPKQMQEEKHKKETLEKITGITNDGIVKNVVALKSNLNNALDEVLQSLTNEFKKLEEIRAAIVIEKQSLEDLYSLSANTDSLAAMLLVHKEKKENFEKEIKELQEQWEQEKNKQKTAEKEYREELTKQRVREEEEYQYNLKIKRQKEQNEYDSKKSQLEKELTDKNAAFEKEISNREQELKNA
ncbi:MAG: hypothetical protein LBT56_03260, partial [Prevotellaceae bacterium]|nr:hypothetical protein [Prevotellaceae bacterium]